jgi:hypothetical protein
MEHTIILNVSFRSEHVITCEYIYINTAQVMCVEVELQPAGRSSTSTHKQGVLRSIELWKKL